MNPSTRYLLTVFAVLAIIGGLGYALNVPQLIRGASAAAIGYGLGCVYFGIHGLVKNRRS